MRDDRSEVALEPMLVRQRTRIGISNADGCAGSAGRIVWIEEDHIRKSGMIS
jgi:hypothetical protein